MIQKFFIATLISASALIPLAAQAQYNPTSSGYVRQDCPAIARILTLGSTGDDVSNLQSFLAEDESIYPEGMVTGYFGPLTREAVKRWQAQHGIASSGDSSTTGWGLVGPRTRALIKERCLSGTSASPANTNTSPSSSGTSAPSSNTNTQPSSSDSLRVDIKAEGSDAPPAVVAGTSVFLSWTSQDAVRCTLRNKLTGEIYQEYTVGSGYSKAVMQQNTYTLICSSADGRTVSDSVTITPRKEDTVSCPIYNACPFGYTSKTSTGSNGCTVLECVPPTTTVPQTGCPVQMAPAVSQCNGVWQSTDYTSSNGCQLKSWICVPPTTTNTDTSSSCPIYSACPSGYTSKTSTGFNGCTSLECIPPTTIQNTQTAPNNSSGGAVNSLGAAVGMVGDAWVSALQDLWNLISGQ